MQSTRIRKICSQRAPLFALFLRALSPSGYPFTSTHRRETGYRFAGGGISFKANSSGKSQDDVNRDDGGVGGVATRIRDVNPDRRPWRWSSRSRQSVARIPGACRTPARDRRGKYADDACFFVRRETGFRPAQYLS